MTYEHPDMFEARRQDAMQDAAEALFEREYSESIAERARESLIEQVARDKELGQAFLDWHAEFGGTREQWVREMERADCQLWTDACDEAACELRGAMADQ